MATVPAVEAPSRARGNLMILVLALSCFVFGCAYQYILGVPDQVAQIAGIDLSQVSLMMGVYGVCNAIGTPLLVMVLTSRGPKTLLLVSLALMAAGMAICAATPIYPVILTGRAVMGVGNGTFAATAYIAASRIAGPSRAASAMSNVALGFSASFVFALPAARMLRNVITWQQAYWVLVVAACIAFAVIALVVRVPEAPHSPAEQGRRSTDALRVFRNPCVVLPLICTVLMFVGYASMNTYITPFMESVLPQPEWVSGSPVRVRADEHDRLEGKRLGSRSLRLGFGGHRLRDASGGNACGTGACHGVVARGAGGGVYMDRHILGIPAGTEFVHHAQRRG